MKHTTQSSPIETMTLTLLFALCFGFPQISFAKLRVVTTVPELASLTHSIGGDEVQVSSLARGTQDPHHLEAKPSYMLAVNRADLLLSIGMDLEVGWLPAILRGARNPKVAAGQNGFFEVGPRVKPLDVPKEEVTREQGDVHPGGNPHILLDPLRTGEIAVKLGERLSLLDPQNAASYQENAKALQKRLLEKTTSWQARIKATGISKVVTYHKTLTYFLDRFDLKNPVVLEPKPGIPPTGPHILRVMNLMKTEKINLILVESFFDSKVAERIATDLPGVRVHSVPVAIDENEDITSLYERIVKIIEGKG